MQALFAWLAANPLALLFTVVLGAVLLDKARLRGYGLGVPGSAILVGAGLSALAAVQEVRLLVDPALRALFLSLFMYMLGLRLGPSLPAAFRGEGLKFSALAVLCSVAGLACAFGAASYLDLPNGAAAGILAGSMTLTAALGAAEQALQHGAAALPAASNPEEIAGMLALAYGVTYIVGAVGFALLSQWMPRWWGVNLHAAAREHEEALGVPHIDDAGITSLRPLAVRAYRLSNDALAGWTVGQFRQKYPEYKVFNVLRSEPARSESTFSEASPALDRESVALAAVGVQSFTRLREPLTDVEMRLRREPAGRSREAAYARLGAPDALALRQGDILTLGGMPQSPSDSASLIGPEIPDPTALNVPLDQAEIVVGGGALEGRELGELRNADFAGQVAIHHIERGGVPLPLGLHVKLQRRDVLFAAGVASAVDKLAQLAGRVARPSAAADLLTLSAGLVLGLVLGTIALPIGAGASVGLGSAGGLLVAGLLVSCLASPLHLVGDTPKAARNLLENMSLAAFAAVVALDAGAALVGLSDAGLVAKLLIAGSIACVIPPLLAWIVGFHLLRLNPAVLIGVIAGARAQEASAREAALDMGSSVAWIGFPVALAVSGALLAALGYLVMAIA
jgi:putative transport protein